MAFSPWGGDAAFPMPDPAASLEPNNGPAMWALAYEEARCAKCGASLDRSALNQLGTAGFCTMGHPLNAVPFFNDVLARATVSSSRRRPRR